MLLSKSNILHTHILCMPTCTITCIVTQCSKLSQLEIIQALFEHLAALVGSDVCRHNKVVGTSLLTAYKAFLPPLLSALGTP